MLAGAVPCLQGIGFDSLHVTHARTHARTHTRTHTHTHTYSHKADAWFLGGTNIIKGCTTRERDKYAGILGGTTAYELLDKFCDRKKRAILSCFCGNDYTGHLFAFTIGAKDKNGRRGRAYTAMRRYCDCRTDEHRARFLQKLQTENRYVCVLAGAVPC